MAIGTREWARRPAWAGVAFGLCSFVLFAVWSVASPVGSVPDEFQHYKWSYAIWSGQVSMSDPTNAYDIPQVLSIPRQDCYTFKPDVPASCDQTASLPDREVLTGTYVGVQFYPPSYYLLTGWPLRFWPDETGIYLGRLLGAALVSVLLGWGMAMVRRAGWPIVSAAVLLCVSPMLAFFAGGYNPQALEIAAAVGLVIGLITVRGPQSTRSAVALAGLSALFLSTVRPLSFVWTVLLAVGVSLAVDLWPRRLARRAGPGFMGALRAPDAVPRIRATSVLVVLGIVVGWVWLRLIPSSGAVSPAAESGVTVRQAIWSALIRMQYFPTEWVGVFGHLDAPVPGVGVAAWWCALGALLLAGWAAAGPRLVAVGLMGILGAVLISVYMEVGSLTSKGTPLIQGRYVLPLFAGVLLLAAVGAERNHPGSTRRWVLWLGVIWAIVNTWAVWESLRRYMFGMSVSPFGEPAWVPPLPAGLLLSVTGAATVLCLLLVDALVWRPLLVYPRRASTADAAG